MNGIRIRRYIGVPAAPAELGDSGPRLFDGGVCPRSDQRGGADGGADNRFPRGCIGNA